jgi:hypothetical protein
MSRHQHPAIRRLGRWLRGWALSLAAAAAAYDPGPLLHLKATRRS